MERRARRREGASALALAGLDPSGGAGLAADLRAFGAAGVWGAAVITVITVQSTAGLRFVRPVEPRLVRAQANEVLTHQNVRSLKSGALGSAENVGVLAAIARAHPSLPLVVDPVLAATVSRGARLLDADALDAMRRLLRRTTLITPNTHEAGALLRSEIRDLKDQRQAAELLVAKGAHAALVKGGHLAGDEAIDVLCAGGRVLLLRAPRLRGPATHGGGCILASLIAGRLARESGDLDDGIVRAVRWAKTRLTRAWRDARCVGDGLLVLPL